MRFCAGLPVAMFIRDARRGAPQSVVEVVQGLEALGFWAITVPDHILNAEMSIIGHTYADVPSWRYADPLAMLSYLAAIPSTLHLMARVLVVPYRQPFATAHALATIDSLSGGRLVFSPGVGNNELEFRTMRIPRHERGRLTDEYIEIMFRLWANEKASFSGRYFQFEEVGLLVRPLQQPRPEVWVGGSSRAALRRAVRIGDAWTPTCFAYPSADPKTPGGVSTRVLREEVAWALAERQALGKPPLEIAVSSAPPLVFLEKSERDGVGGEVDFFTCRGTPDELCAEFLAYQAAGATSFVVNFPGNSPAEYLRSAEIFAREIMPALQAHAGTAPP